jgi:hypothetical protein
MFICIDYYLSKEKYLIADTNSNQQIVTKDIVKRNLKSGIQVQNLTLADNGQIVFKRIVATPAFEDVNFLYNLGNAINRTYNIIPIVLEKSSKQNWSNISTNEERVMCDVINSILVLYRQYIHSFNYKNKHIECVTSEYFNLLNDYIETKNINTLNNILEMYNKKEGCIYQSEEGIYILQDFVAILNKAIINCLQSQDKILDLNVDLRNRKQDVIKDFYSWRIKHIKEKEKLAKDNYKLLNTVNSNLKLSLRITKGLSNNKDYNALLDKSNERIKSVLKDYTDSTKGIEDNKNSNVSKFIQSVLQMFEDLGGSSKYANACRLLVKGAKTVKSEVIHKYRDILGVDLYSDLSVLYTRHKYIFFDFIFMYDINVSLKYIHNLLKVKNETSDFFKFYGKDKYKSEVPYNTIQCITRNNLQSAKFDDFYAQILVNIMLLDILLLDYSNTKYRLNGGLKYFDSRRYYWSIDSCGDYWGYYDSWLCTLYFVNNYVKYEYRNNDVVFGVIFKDYYKKYCEKEALGVDKPNMNTVNSFLNKCFNENNTYELSDEEKLAFLI